MHNVFHFISVLYIATIVAKRNSKSSEVLADECSTQESAGFPASPPPKYDVIKKSTASINIVRARNLLPSDSFLEGSSSDPFVELKTDSHLYYRYGRNRKVQTPVVSQNLNPEWNCKIEVEFDYRCSEFKFKIYDSDTFSEHDKMGKVEVPLSKFTDQLREGMDGAPIIVEGWFPVVNKHVYSPHGKHPFGELYVVIEVNFKVPYLNIGMRIELPSDRIFLGLGWDFKKHDGSPLDLDSSIAGFNETDQLSSRDDIIYYQKKDGFKGAIHLYGDDRTGKGDGDDETIAVQLSSIPQRVEKFVIAVLVYGRGFLSQAKSAYIRLTDGIQTLGFYRLRKKDDPYSKV
eukprot:TRINITY_DN8251_c0_g1_i4.p1 TRINITY_DN8251_c0_g1~~TRINITY_DN8251_c0_g1_i4.p1  ORF type:complete len:345 (+),score=22.50 TRINITY_DN8251_c0_g1_i4:85-1119(+)